MGLNSSHPVSFHVPLARARGGVLNIRKKCNFKWGATSTCSAVGAYLEDLPWTDSIHGGIYMSPKGTMHLELSVTIMQFNVLTVAEGAC